MNSPDRRAAAVLRVPGKRLPSSLVSASFFMLLIFSACTSTGPGVQGKADPADEETASESGGQEGQGRSGRMRIVFFGDSITEAGVRPGGYVSLVEDWLKDLHPDRNIDVVASGVAGDTVPDLQDRLDRDVLAKNPTHVVVYIGVNDVGQIRFASKASNRDKQTYRIGLLDLVERIQGSGAKPILCTPAVFGEDPASESNANRLLDEYAAISRQVAAETGVPLCDLRAAFTEFLQVHNPSRRNEGVLTIDGVHLNDKGNHLVSLQILKILNVREAEAT